MPIDVEKIAATARTAIVRVLIFDPADKPLKPAVGCFISADGRFVTSADAVEHAGNAVIELRSAAMKNVLGLLASSSDAGVAIMKADMAGTPFLPIATAMPQIGAQVAVVGLADAHAKTAFAATVAAVHDESGGAALELTGTNLKAEPGAPVLNDAGEIVAFITDEEGGASLTAVRSVAAVTALLEQLQANATPKWLASPTPSPTPRASQSPSASARPDDAVLVYTPYPRYPAAARFSYTGSRFGSGQYLIQFGADGAAQRISILRSTGNALLDQAAVDALKSWRAQRGRPTQKILPITFRP
jgi:TonB family protein